MSLPSGEHTLHEELAAIDREFPGWHAFMGRDEAGEPSGNFWAVTARNDESRGGGTTVDARTPDLLRHEIAEQQHRWLCRRSAA